MRSAGARGGGEHGKEAGEQIMTGAVADPVERLQNVADEGFAAGG